MAKCVDKENCKLNFLVQKKLRRMFWKVLELRKMKIK